MSAKANRLFGFLFIVFFIFGITFFSGCQIDPGAEDPGLELPEEETPEEEPQEEPVPIPPPENLLGTIALSNGTSAVMDFQFPAVSANYLPGITPRTTVGVTGKVRYDGRDFTAGGLYDDATAEMDIWAKHDGTGEKFIFSGTYTPGTGFSGTVVLVAADLSTIATGSVSVVEAEDSERDSIRIFTGSVGGMAYGTWNGTLTMDHFYGSYSVMTPVGSMSGSFSCTRSGDLITLTTSDGDAGGGTINGPTINGWWRNGDYDANGYWSGYEVDSNYDQHVPSAGDDASFCTNLFYQAFQNGVSLYTIYTDTLVDSDYDTSHLPSESGFGYIIAPVYQGIRVTSYGIFDPGEGTFETEYAIYNFDSYSDNQTGLILDGQYYAKATTDPVTEALLTLSMLLDSDVSDSDGTDDLGFKATFTDDSIAYLYIDTHINFETGALTAFNQADPVWTISDDTVYGDADDDDVVATMADILVID